MAYRPGFPRHYDIHKLQQHHLQNGPKCQGNWYPAAKPQKLYLDDQVP